MKTAFVYSDDFVKFDYGSGHPLTTVRLKLTSELIRACGLLGPGDSRIVEPVMAGEEEVLSFHAREYVDVLKAVNSGRAIPGSSRFGLGPGDNPVFPGLFDWSRLVTGGSLLAAELVDRGRTSIAFAPGGGLHHARSSQASGFCYVNDPVIAIQSLVNRGRRVAYIDIDAHHGDGVQEAFYATDRVLTISLHETGAALFPGSGFEHETGTGAGTGYSVNIPLPPGSDDEIFLHAFSRTVPWLIETFKPDVIVSQLGVDTFRTDPLSDLNCTTNGFTEAVSGIKAMAPRWVALGGGGYDVSSVARAWTLAWAIMNDTEAPDGMPEEFLRKHPQAGFRSGSLRDEPFRVEGAEKEKMIRETDRVIGYIREHALRTSSTHSHARRS